MNWSVNSDVIANFFQPVFCHFFSQNDNIHRQFFAENLEFLLFHDFQMMIC